VKGKAVLVALIVLSLLVGAFALGSYFGETPKPAPSGGNVVDNTLTTPPTPTVPHTETLQSRPQALVKRLSQRNRHPRRQWK